MMNAITLILANLELIVSSVALILSGVIAISMIIPGNEPETTLKKVVAFIEKFSKK